MERERPVRPDERRRAPELYQLQGPFVAHFHWNGAANRPPALVIKEETVAGWSGSSGSCAQALPLVVFASLLAALAASVMLFSEPQSGAVSDQVATPKGVPPHARASVTPGAQGPSPQELERQKQFETLLHAAAEAEKRGDYVFAEAEYREALRLRPSPQVRLLIARMLERTGHESDALPEYRAVVLGEPNVWSSYQDDPTILAHYGDLCLKYRRTTEARDAYAKAAAQPRRTFGDARLRWDPTTEPRNGSLPALVAAAHTASALDSWGHGDDGAFRKELDLALKADPDWWVPHFYRARDWAMYRAKFPKEDPAKEATLAERLAPPADKRMVTEMRRRSRIPDLQGNLLPTLPVPRPGIDRPTGPEGREWSVNLLPSGLL